jgi:hypothetical protein
MGMAKRSIPEMTDDEIREWEERFLWQEFLSEDITNDAEAAADDAAAERKHPHADPHCGYCLGTGIVRDWVDYGSTVVSMDSTCDCVEDGDNG